MLDSIAPTWWPPTSIAFPLSQQGQSFRDLLKARLLPLCGPMKTRDNATVQPVDNKANLVELVILVNLGDSEASAELELLFVDL